MSKLISVVFPLPGPPLIIILYGVFDPIIYGFIYLNYICVKIAVLMIPKENPEEFYSRFHEQLTDSQEWPGPFLFKFIIRGDQQKVEKLKQIFESKQAKLKLKNSSKNTFVSVTFLAEMENPTEVINIYRAASTIEGIITL
ncbi:DUF493 domain-containing protein [Flavobacteriaceae bacterium]|nr:DUF493 domain-containing protein [Flavobacteriaceae bacterium]MDC1460475.1 DUF493 domain-containing protein [Flavobacteriaceae bacterium]